MTTLIALPPMDDDSVNEMTSPFWALVKTLMSKLPSELDSLSSGDRRKAIAEILFALSGMEECRPPIPLDQYAARYAYLRDTHWESHPLCVVSDPKNSVKLGHDCPSGQRLDELIDMLTSKGAQ